MTTGYTTEYLNSLIDEATIDAYGESEQAVGFFTMIEDHLAIPFTTNVLERAVTVTGVDITENDQIVASCQFGNSSQRISILDLPLPTPPPDGVEWIIAYRHWIGG